MADIGNAGANERVHRATSALAAGSAVVVLDDIGGEDEGELVFAAEFATPKLLAFSVEHTSGFVCVALTSEDCHRLELPPMAQHDRDGRNTAYRVTVDRIGSGTGISSIDRAHTVAALAAEGSRPGDFSRPGHVIPLRSRDGGILRHPGRTEAAVDLARLAGLRPAAAMSEIVSTLRPSEMARGAEVADFAHMHGLRMVCISDLIRYRRNTEPQVERVVATTLPTRWGRLRAIGFRGIYDGTDHVALITGDVTDSRAPSPIPVHVHTECLTGDVFGSSECECAVALEEAMRVVMEQERGVVVYVRAADSPNACGLLTSATNTITTVGSAEVAAAILADLGVHTVQPVGPTQGLREILLERLEGAPVDTERRRKQT
ncbi:3,4-dihydroxy-2-butanone-4-phosphate synthase [Nocardia jiangxiensis]|uniref:3,4-dihydroxy-2-butanone-4-phosphate synthase n=1 Tax=Nocardia jiangxiensis TaxID=282685 RepID=UPI0002D3C15A|nr:3,4-dihydroxy-2-butanone-4-phosphate synthase [Nocardia jiangxiensis]